MMNRKWMMSLGLALTLSVGAYAQDTTRITRDTTGRLTPEEKVDQSAAQIGGAAEKGTKVVGDAAITAGRAIGKAGKATGQAVKKTAKATAQGVSNAAKATKRKLDGETKSDSVNREMRRDTL